jgi:hypothetical protein
MNNTLTIDEALKLAQAGSPEGDPLNFSSAFIGKQEATAKDLWDVDTPLLDRVFILESGNMLPTQWISGVKSEMGDLLVNKDVLEYRNFQASGTLWRFGMLAAGIRKEQHIPFVDAFVQVQDIVSASISGYLG